MSSPDNLRRRKTFLSLDNYTGWVTSEIVGSKATTACYTTNTNSNKGGEGGSLFILIVALQWGKCTHLWPSKLTQTDKKQRKHSTRHEEIHISCQPPSLPHAEFWSLPSCDKQTNCSWRSPEAIGAHRSPTITRPVTKRSMHSSHSSWDTLR